MTHGFVLAITIFIVAAGAFAGGFYITGVVFFAFAFAIIMITMYAEEIIEWLNRRTEKKREKLK